MGLIRFGVSLDKELLQQFDRLCGENKYQNRSEAIRDLIRDTLVKKEWSKIKGEITGVVTLAYDHHIRELTEKLTDIQHDHQDIIISSQHIHMDHNNCLEIIAVKGDAKEAKDLAAKLRSTKGVKHGEFVMTTTGKGLK